VNCGPLYPEWVGIAVPPDVFAEFEDVAGGSVESEVASGCAGDSVEDGKVSNEESEEDVLRDASEVSSEVIVSVASGMKEVERIISSDCVTIGFPSGST